MTHTLPCLVYDLAVHGYGPVEEGELTSECEDPNLHHGDPSLSQLVLTEEEQRDFDSFNEMSTSSQSKKGKPRYGRFAKRIQDFTHKLSRLLASLRLSLPAQRNSETVNG